MRDLILTKNFRLSEFEASTTAKALGIANVADVQTAINLQQLCINVLQPLRDMLSEPLIINSGYRCKQLNSAVGGVKNSQHLTGEAADIHCPSAEYADKLMKIIRENFDFDQLIRERASRTSKVYWIHVSFVSTSKNRRQVISDLIKN